MTHRLHTRRDALALLGAALTLPGAARASAPREIMWEDLIPPGVPYGEIIGEGYLDWDNDIWEPVFDENAFKLNPALDNAYIRMPGFIIPLELSLEGVRSFVLVPYLGACIHVPPPPPNQLVFAEAAAPLPAQDLWDAVWVTGTMRTELQMTEIAETGYALAVESMELYEW
ncbi:MAG: DUF3299 domain-containing protein [Pseudomonadota bacterium]